eukprot:GILJ01017935.1.p1 GENE.GILJ01017935.1~~GILJ01017935.1.p1  ORF type:complete len:980 (-),score=152.47 GILJ01017935.1:9-2882(-)
MAAIPVTVPNNLYLIKPLTVAEKQRYFSKKQRSPVLDNYYHYNNLPPNEAEDYYSYFPEDCPEDDIKWYYGSLMEEDMRPPRVVDFDNEAADGGEEAEESADVSTSGSTSTSSGSYSADNSRSHSVSSSIGADGKFTCRSFSVNAHSADSEYDTDRSNQDRDDGAWWEVAKTLDEQLIHGDAANVKALFRTSRIDYLRRRLERGEERLQYSLDYLSVPNGLAGHVERSDEDIIGVKAEELADPHLQHITPVPSGFISRVTNSLFSTPSGKGKDKLKSSPLKLGSLPILADGIVLDMADELLLLAEHSNPPLPHQDDLIHYAVDEKSLRFANKSMLHLADVALLRQRIRQAIADKEIDEKRPNADHNNKDPEGVGLTVINLDSTSSDTDSYTEASTSLSSSASTSNSADDILDRSPILDDIHQAYDFAHERLDADPTIVQKMLAKRGLPTDMPQEGLLMGRLTPSLSRRKKKKSNLHSAMLLGPLARSRLAPKPRGRLSGSSPSPILPRASIPRPDWLSSAPYPLAPAAPAHLRREELSFDPVLEGSLATSYDYHIPIKYEESVIEDGYRSNDDDQGSDRRATDIIILPIPHPLKHYSPLDTIDLSLYELHCPSWVLFDVGEEFTADLPQPQPTKSDFNDYDEVFGDTSVPIESVGQQSTQAQLIRQYHRIAVILTLAHGMHAPKPTMPFPRRSVALSLIPRQLFNNFDYTMAFESAAPLSSSPLSTSSRNVDSMLPPPAGKTRADSTDAYLERALGRAGSGLNNVTSQEPNRGLLLIMSHEEFNSLSTAIAIATETEQKRFDVVRDKKSANGSHAFYGILHGDGGKMLLRGDEYEEDEDAAEGTPSPPPPVIFCDFAFPLRTIASVEEGESAKPDPILSLRKVVPSRYTLSDSTEAGASGTPTLVEATAALRGTLVMAVNNGGHSAGKTLMQLTMQFERKEQRDSVAMLLQSNEGRQ